MMNTKSVVPLTTPPKKKLHIGIKIGIVFAISFVLFMVCAIVSVMLRMNGLKLNLLFSSLLGITLPILVILIGIPLVLILHYAKK